MHSELVVLIQLSACLVAALVLGFVTQRLNLSPIVGYLLAGVAVGPQTPGFIADRASAALFAEIGIILLMFGVGLHFNLSLTDTGRFQNVATGRTASGWRSQWPARSFSPVF